VNIADSNKPWIFESHKGKQPQPQKIYDLNERRLIDGELTQRAIAISRSTKRPADLVARYGGEEFVVVLPNTPSFGAFKVAEDIRLGVKALDIFHSRSQEMRVTLSLGVASTVPIPKSSPGRLIAEADKALYQAKAQGRNRTVVESLPEE